MSDIETSDFYKTFEQFILEDLNGKQIPKQYILVTTTDTSKKIKNDLQKIVLSIQLNYNAFNENPLNESEKDTLKKVKEIVTTIYSKHGVSKISDRVFSSLLKKISIEIVDIENSHPIEKAAIMMLSSLGFKNPELIWSVLIKNCLFYASQRMSIDKVRLKDILDKYIHNEQTIGDDPELQREFFQTKVTNMGEFSVDRDVLLIESFEEKFDYMIVDLQRFTDDCKPKNIYFDNKVMVSSGDVWTVIQRFATHAGLDRYLDKNIAQLKGERIAIIPAIADINEESNCSELHRRFLDNLINTELSPLNCLHCGKVVYNSDALVVEVDDRDSKNAVGLIHEACIRSIDRVLGVPIIPTENKDEYLANFDFNLWISLIIKGQGLLNGLKFTPNITQGHPAIIAWHPNEYDAEYSFCVRFTLEDGSFSYDYHRSRIVRLNKLEAESRKDVYEKRMTELNEKNDPFCVTSIGNSPGPYSHLVKTKNQEEEILEIKKIEVTKYSKLVAKVFDKDISFYAPICIVRDIESEQIFNISNVIPLISDPLNFRNLVKNWKAAGIEIENVELKIIKSDKDFDNYVRMFLADDYVPFIDLELDKNGKPVKGFPIHDYDELMKKSHNLPK